MTVSHKMKWAFFCLLLSLPALTWTIEDSYRAYKGTQEGDRWRLFMYYQTARYEGVQVALDRYGEHVTRR